MNIEQIREYALSFNESEEDCPFGPSVVVFKVGGKIFMLLPLDTDDLRFNVKCDPELAITQRQEFPDHILPGFHMNKKHWNTIIADGHLSDTQLKQFITDSYHLVKPKKKLKPKEK